MKRLFKLTIMASFGVGLSSCAYTHKVMQNAYDGEARKQCESTAGETDTKNPKCNGGDYFPN